MPSSDPWKYCTKEYCDALLADFRLFGAWNWTKEQQIACLYAVSNHIPDHYYTAFIPKSGGGMRKLEIPDTLLKMIQRNILHHILDNYSVSSHGKAYRKGISILENAKGHVGKKKVLKLDIRDFFGNITFYLVYQCVFNSYNYPPQIGTLLTHLCCLREHLPQGAPASAAISNIVMKPFDEYMGDWCEKRGITYSRYCDDMTFSGEFEPYVVKNKVRTFLSVIGFELNDRKSRVLLRNQRQEITGIVVNHRPRVSKAYRKKLRQEVYYCRKYGVVSHLSHIQKEELPPPDANQLRRYAQSLHGKINFVLQINAEDQYFQDAKMWIMGLLKSASWHDEFSDTLQSQYP